MDIDSFSIIVLALLILWNWYENDKTTKKLKKRIKKLETIITEADKKESNEFKS